MKSKVKRHRANIRLKRLVYDSRAAFWEIPTNYELIEVIELKMSKLIKVLNSDRLAEVQKNSVFCAFNLLIYYQSALYYLTQ
jgi:hypothetical protein